MPARTSLAESPSQPMMDFVRRIHFVGIGGIGMSGIAEVLLNLGYSVTGSDLKETQITRRLESLGARVFIGHRSSQIGRAQVVVTSSAVAPANPEVAAARRLKVPVVPRAAMLAELARLKKTVTISGTHGKTTTTSMVALALKAAGADPTIIIGGQLSNIGSNARLGTGDYLVAEADESDGSFLELRPLVAVVTNIDDDHLDHYGSMANLKKAFLEHLHRLPFYGAAVLCADDPVLRTLIPKVQRPVIRYGLGPGAQWRGRILPRRAKDAGLRMQVLHRGRPVGLLALKVPGRHNATNALAAVAVGSFLGMDLKKVFRGLAAFKGVGRRIDRLGKAGGVLFIDDYGHHPTEIKATLETIAESRPKRLIVVFQPHRFSRTKLLHRHFGPAFAKADAVYVTDIYPAGEKPVAGVGPGLVLDSLRRAGVEAFAFTRAVDLVRELKAGDVVVTQGAGDVWKIGMDLLRRLQAKAFAAL